MHRNNKVIIKKDVEKEKDEEEKEKEKEEERKKLYFTTNLFKKRTL